MNKWLKLALQIGFLAVVIWELAALAGKAPGFAVRIGNRKFGDKRRRDCSRGPDWVATGMESELIATPGTDVADVGRPYSAF